MNNYIDVVQDDPSPGVQPFFFPGPFAKFSFCHMIYIIGNGLNMNIG